MTKKEKQFIAKEIVRLSKEEEKNENNISENFKKIESLVEKCSLFDLLEIDEIITKNFQNN